MDAWYQSHEYLASSSLYPPSLIMCGVVRSDKVSVTEMARNVTSFM